MKKITLVLFLFASIFLNSCLKGPNHSIRITNYYPEKINNIKIGSVGYGSVEYQKTTAYNPVEDGTHTLSGSSSSGGTLSGSVSISGRGTHKWTLTILSNGGLDFKEDKK